MKEIILIKNGEIALKGLNRSVFEDALQKALRHRLSKAGRFKIRRAQSTMFVEPQDDGCDMDLAAEAVGKVFGIVAYSRAAVCEKDMDVICTTAVDYLADQLRSAKTFKVVAKRSDKSFPLGSPEISAELGGYILSKFPHLKVDVHDPEVTVAAEIRDFAAYVRAGQLKGAGGIPVGTGGKAAILISGGIDSPVAAWMMAKRGMQLTAIHFASPPYTGPQAEAKVRDLLKKVSEYSGEIRFCIVPFTRIQEAIADNCQEEYFTIIMRRFMMRISERIARRNKCSALITGESLGQVASQTVGGLVCTDAVCNMPVFRPLIGMDKEEIIVRSREIGTFDISILPYEDCCTVFTPKHPRTKPLLDKVEAAEAALDIEALVEEAAENALFESI
ncbi:MAG: tRNA 4-thiouridine(8) synthase ThiI [Clostridia bacterium]|nr:tRNA 4-thiouridine(8) synthase ThiI [Clostridia bacterium]